MKILTLFLLFLFAWLAVFVSQLAETTGEALMFYALILPLLAGAWFCGWCAAAARHSRRHPALPPRTDGVIEAAFQNRAIGKRESGKA